MKHFGQLLRDAWRQSWEFERAEEPLRGAHLAAEEAARHPKHSCQLISLPGAVRVRADRPPDGRPSVTEEHILAPTSDPRETIDWLKWRGYRGVLVTASVYDAGSMFGYTPGALLFGRKNEIVKIAEVGDVLTWDGTDIQVR
jgi:hypothetical protein